MTPGGVDAHVHLTDPIRGDPEWHWSDDFESGTRAALAGGITTVGNMSFPPRDGTIADAIEQDDADARVLVVTGWPKWTISRGEVVQEDGRVTAARGRARLVRRGAHRAI